MALLFNLQKKLLKQKIAKVKVQSKKLSDLKKKEAKQFREIKKLRDSLKKASSVNISKSDKAILNAKSKDLSSAQAKRKKKLNDALKVSSEAGKILVSVGKNIGDFVDGGKKRGSKRSSRRKRYY